MQKLCIDVRGFSEEKKKRVQDAFFELGYGWVNGGRSHKYTDSDTKNYVLSGDSGFLYRNSALTPNITYPELMHKAGMNESDPDARHSLQPGDYTTREEIITYAGRVGITLDEAYQRVCDAFVACGAPIGEGVEYITERDLFKYGWSADENEIYFGSVDNTVDFTRHLTPDQILTAGKQEGLQSEKQVDAEREPPKKIGELTLGIELTTDLQTVISDYMYLLDVIKDPYARGVIKSQITDLTDLQYKQLSGENENA